MGKPSSVKQRSKFFRSYVMFSSTQKITEKHGKRMQKMNKKNFLFLRHCRGTGNIQVKDGERGKSKGHGENLLNMREREREI